MMKKITMLITLFVCAIGFSQNAKGVSEKGVTKTTTVTHYFKAAPADAMETIDGKQRKAGNVTYQTAVYNGQKGIAELAYTSGSVVNSPGTPDRSILESVSLGMGTYGAGVQLTATANNRIAEDIILDSDYDITSIDLYGYQTGSTNTTATINLVNLQVWDGDPSDPASSVIWGNTTDNVLASAVWSGAYRVLEDDLNATNRPIYRLTVEPVGLSLDAGTYWLDWQYGGTLASGPWQPPVATLGQIATGNSIQSQAGVWAPVIDVGPQGAPVDVYGDLQAVFPEPYCGPLAYGTVEPITLVDFAGISNVSDAAVGGTSHEDYTAIEGDVAQGMTYTITLEGNTDGAFNATFVVFFDWNQNDVLDDAGEVYEVTEVLNSSTGTDGKQVMLDITVPADALIGSTRMRVKKKFGLVVNLDPCVADTFGQAEDYTVNVNLPFPQPYCGPLAYANAVEPITLVDFAGISNVSDAAVDGSPDHEDFTDLEGEVRQGFTYNIKLEGNTDGAFTDYFTVFIDWNQNELLDDAGEVYVISSTLNGSTGTDGMQVMQDLMVPEDALLGSTRMRVIKQFGVATLDPCAVGGFGQTEDYTVNVSIGLVFPEPYCGPLAFTSAVEPITLVDFAGISNVSDATVGGTAHEDFTDINGIVIPGMTYTVTLEGNTDGNFTDTFTVFVDWNQNELLDDAGEVYEITTPLINSTGTDGIQIMQDLVVPVDALLGSTRMRVIKKFNTPAPLDPCLGAAFGQAEDYTISVIADAGDCDQMVVSNGFENGATSSTVGPQVIANDIIVDADVNFSLNTISVNFLMPKGDTVVSADIISYGDIGGLPDSATVIDSQLALAPTSQSVIGEFDPDTDVSEINFDIADVMLNGQPGVESVYWLSVYVTTSSGGAAFWERTTATRIGSVYAFSPDNGVAWNLTGSGGDGVYTFSGECVPIILEVSENALEGFSFYPNPASSTLSLKAANNIDAVSLYNLLGQKVIDMKVDATTSEINVSGLSAGTYIMKVDVDGQIGTYKVLKN